jgi:toxin ParE1/3/4
LKPARLRPRAEQDLLDVSRYYAETGGATLGETTFSAALAALEVMQRSPAIGSLRLGEFCEVPGLRSWGVTGIPLRWSYFERDDHLDIVRLLGEREDITAILGENP